MKGKGVRVTETGATEGNSKYTYTDLQLVYLKLRLASYLKSVSEQVALHSVRRWK